jgi:hypothetical protein
MFRKCSFGVGRTPVRFGVTPYPDRGPGPVLSAGDESGANGVLAHVLERRGQPALPLDHTHGEAGAEEVSGAFVATVEALRVSAVQELDAGGQRAPGGFDDQVVVVPHQAEAVDEPAVTSDRSCKRPEERDAVQFVEEDRAAVDAARADVVDPVRQVATTHARHPWTLGVTKGRNAPATLSAHFGAHSGTPTRPLEPSREGLTLAARAARRSPARRQRAGWARITATSTEASRPVVEL